MVSNLLPWEATAVHPVCAHTDRAVYTCCCAGQVYMSYVAADALFLVCQVDNSNTFAFRSLG